MNKQSFITILLTMLMSMTGAKAFAHDIEVKNSDDVTIYYVWTNNNTELAVSYGGWSYDSYSNEYTGEVVIPESVKYNGNTYNVTAIGKYAFYGCSRLTSVTIPNSVKSIGSYAFQGCTNLLSATIPNAVTSIGSYAFDGCSRLATITATNSVTSIGSNAFNGTEWYNNLPDGLVYVGKILYRYKGEMPENTSINIADGTIGLAMGAFSDCKGLTTITIPNSVSSISSSSFYNCSSLTSVTIPNSVASIGQSAFAYCSALTSVTIPSSVTSIGSYAFQQCSSLTSMIFPEGLTSVGSSAFNSCSSLTTLSIPKNVTSIGDEAFSNCRGLTTIRSDIENPFEINTNVFSNYSYSSYTTATLIVPSGKKAAYLSISGWSSFNSIVETGEGGVFGKKIEVDGINYIIGENHTVSLTSNNQKYSGNIEIPQQVTYNGKKYDVTSIGNSAFSNCPNLNSVTIPNTVTSIGNSAFNNCNGLTSITIPNNVTSVGSNAFSGTAWYNSQTDGLIYVGKVAYCYKGEMPANTNIAIADGTTQIASNAFSGCSGLLSVTIPNSVTSIDGYAFNGCTGLATITSEIENPYEIETNVFNTSYYSSNIYSNATFIVPSGTKEIYKNTSGWSSFVNIVEKGEGGIVGKTIEVDGVKYIIGEENTVSLTSNNQKYSGDFEIPNQATYNGKTYSVTSIRESAFSGCIDLTSVIIPNSIVSIGATAFQNCSNLIAVIIPSSVISIGNNAFRNCSSLKTAELHCTTIDSWFSNFSSLQEVIIGEEATTIVNSAFYNCSSLSKLTIPSSVKSVGTNAFYGTAWFNNQPDGIVYIGNVVYKYKGEMPANTSISLKEGTTEIVSEAFSGYTGLTSVTIPNSVTSIGGYAFSGCTGLTTLTIPSSVTSIGSYAFQNCSSLTTILSEIENPFEIANVFSNIYYYSSDIYSQATLIVPKGTKAAYQSTKDWSSFVNIIETGDGGIAGKTFEVNGVNYIIGENNTVSLTSNNNKYSGDFEIPSQVTYNGIKYSVTSISSSAFYECSGLTSVIIPNSVTIIGTYAFYKCSNLISVILPNNLTSIEEGTFNNCRALASIIIPNSVTSIGKEAFAYCSALASLIIGTGVTSIGNNAFKSTTLKKTIWLTNTPPSNYSIASGAVNYVSNDQFALTNQVVYKFLSSYFDVDGIRYVPVSTSERICDAIDCVYDKSAKDTKIASTVKYKEVTMNVKNINSYLAYGNKYIESLNIDTEDMLASYAFTNCTNLKSVVYGNKITGFGVYVFGGCSSLTSVKTTDNIPQDNVIYISKNINSIEDYAFSGCSEIMNVIMADSDTELKLGSNGNNPLFHSCPLDYVYIGRNINYRTESEYGNSPFYRNTTLREIKITDKETEISENEFYGCTNLQSVTIGDGVTNIGNWAFSGCQSLLYFAFGSQVKNIGQEAFSDCSAMVEVISKAKTAPACGNQALDDINKFDCKLYVPDGCMATYANADQWKDFLFKEEGEGTAGQGTEDPNKGKCETPTISIDGNKLSFACKTSGVIFHYSITNKDAKTDVSNGEITLTNNYEVSVYASKEGYKDSDVARQEVNAKGLKPGDVNNDGVVNVADHVELSKIIMNQDK